MKKFSVIVFLLFLSFTLYSQEVKTITSTDEYKALLDNSKGKVILVNFWATWCPPCVKEFPELVKLYNDYKDKEFVLMFISLDDKSEYDSKLLPFLKKQGVDFTSYFGNFSNPETIMNYVDKSWQGEIPYTGIYDKDGKLVKSLLGNKTYEQFETEIKQVMD
jgi:thiol-disulfide isomerase/thioredoxin